MARAASERKPAPQRRLRPRGTGNRAYVRLCLPMPCVGRGARLECWGGRYLGSGHCRAPRDTAAGRVRWEPHQAGRFRAVVLLGLERSLRASTPGCEHQELVVGRWCQAVVTAAHADVREACPLKQQHQLAAKVHPHRQLIVSVATTSSPRNRVPRSPWRCTGRADRARARGCATRASCRRRRPCARRPAGTVPAARPGRRRPTAPHASVRVGRLVVEQQRPPGSSASWNRRSACSSWARLLPRPTRRTRRWCGIDGAGRGHAGAGGAAAGRALAHARARQRPRHVDRRVAAMDAVARQQPGHEQPTCAASGVECGLAARDEPSEVVDLGPSSMNSAHQSAIRP